MALHWLRVTGPLFGALLFSGCLKTSLVLRVRGYSEENKWFQDNRWLFLTI